LIGEVSGLSFFLLRRLGLDCRGTSEEESDESSRETSIESEESSESESELDSMIGDEGSSCDI